MLLSSELRIHPYGEGVFGGSVLGKGSHWNRRGFVMSFLHTLCR